MQKCEDVPISLSSWAVLDCEVGAEELYTCRQGFQEMMGVYGGVAAAGRSNKLWCLVLESKLTEIYSSSKTYTDDVMSITNLKWINIGLRH